MPTPAVSSGYFGDNTGYGPGPWVMAGLEHDSTSYPAIG
ncbi:Uncharacterised protein [Amycolatopsis camponoti]|uniref:Uncharacterized protein n=1 Tax=Amycolatopsis camponoti TaxID=2606593 RepID=A0A6I8LIS1_9PSEU|nr:Uncharacterised protein [Amycolatopsis camponoti]